MYRAYIRVSKKEQSFGRQVVAITKYIKRLKELDKKKKEKELEELIELKELEKQERQERLKELEEQERLDRLKKLEESEELEKLVVVEDEGVDMIEGIPIYKDKMTGAKLNRPYFKQMLEELKKGDVVIVIDITRISRSTLDLLNIIKEIKEKGASIQSLSDSWLDTSDESPNSELILTVMSAISQFERRSLSKRTKEGLEAARLKGHFGGRPSDRNKVLDTIKYMVKGGASVPEIMKEVGLSRATVYRAIQDLREKGEL